MRGFRRCGGERRCTRWPFCGPLTEIRGASELVSACYQREKNAHQKVGDRDDFLGQDVEVAAVRNVPALLIKAGEPLAKTASFLPIGRQLVRSCVEVVALGTLPPDM
jgi:hypothetical protein